MSIIIRDGTNAGHLLAVDAFGNMNVVISGSIAAGSNLIGQVEITDGVNVLGTVAHPVVVSSAPAADRIVTGNITSSPSAVSISTQGGGTVLFNITGTWTGTINFEASVDGTNWVPAIALPKYPSGGTAVSSTTSNGQWAVNTGGLNMFRVHVTAAWSGTAAIWLEVGQATNVQEVFQFFPSNFQTNINASGTALTATGSALDVNIASGSSGVQYANGTAVGTPTGTVALGYDGANVRALLTSVTGVLSVDGSATTQPVSADGVIDPNNSSVTPLGAGGVFTGTTTDLLSYTSVRISVFTDQDSAANGFTVQFSEDGTNWDFISEAQVLANDGVSAPFGRQSRYMRVVYTNGATPQTAFRLQTILQKFAVQIDRNFLGNLPEDSDTAQITQSVLIGHNAGGGSSYVAVKVTAGGAISVNPPNNATTNLTQVNGSTVSLGQTTMSASLPVAIASDQSAIPVSGTIAISGTVAVTQSTSPWVVSNGGTFAVQATQAGTWNIGTVTAVTAITNPLPAGTNVIGHVITDSGSTTAVTGTVAVTQSTSPWVVSLTSTTITGTVAVTQSGTWNIGTLTSITNTVNVAGTLTHNAAAPVADNIGALVAVASTGAPTYNNGDQVLLSTDLAGNLRVSGSLTVTDADTVGSAGNLNANNATATVATTGQGGAGVLIATGTLAATVVAEVSYDGGTTWVASVFYDSATNTTSASLVFTNPNAATTRSILIDGGVSNARVRVSAFTSGAASATLRSTFNSGGQYVNQGSGPWTQNLTQVNSVALGSPSNYGTSPGSVSVLGVNAFITNTVPVTLTSTTITGTVAVTQSTSPWVVSNSGTFAVQATQSGTWNIGTVTAVTAITNALPAGTNVIGHVITDTGSTTAVTGTVAVTQSTTPWVVNQTQSAGVALGATAVTNFGTAPAAAAVIGANASIYAGTTGITATGSSLNANITNTVAVTLTSTTITGTVAVTQSTSPWVVNQTQVAGTALGATAVTNFGTAPAAAAVPGVNANIYSAGAAITAAAPLGVQLSQGNAVISNTNPIFSSITDGTTKVTVIAATAALKTDASSVAGTATVTAAAGVQKVGIVGNTAATLDSTAAAATAPTNAILTSATYNSTVPALTNGQAVAAECDTTGSLYQNSEGRKQSYRVGIVAFTLLASSTAPSISLTGSATKTIRITRIRISATAATGTACDLILKRYSALSGGTANSQSANIAKMDTNNAAQTAVVNQWSAVATTTTAAGILNAERYEIVTAAVSVNPGYVEWSFGDKNAQALVVRGTGDFIGFCVSAVGTTNLADFWLEWTEE